MRLDCWSLRTAILLICIAFEVVLTEKCELRNDRIEEGRRCRKPCVASTDCRSRSKTCNCDGACGMTCYNRDAVCNEPESIPNGWITKSGITMQSNATYSCNNGFMLHGNRTRICCADKKWHPAPPICTNTPATTVEISSPPTSPSGVTKKVAVTFLDSATNTTVSSSLAPSNCYSAADDGESYRGLIATTENGNPCQKWIDQSPHQHSRTPKNYPSVGLESNYCRNPDFEEKPWCYTTNPKKRWEYCNVSSCSEIEPGVIPDEKSTSTRLVTSENTPTSIGVPATTTKPSSTMSAPSSRTIIVDLNCSFSLDTCGYENHGWQREADSENGHIESLVNDAILTSPVITPQYAIGSYICLTFKYRFENQANLSLQFSDRYPNDYLEWSSHPQEISFSWLDSFLNIPISQKLQYQFKASGSVQLDDINARNENCYDRCEPNPCKNGGTCVSRLDKFTCFCPVDYVGEVCETDIKCSEPLRRPNTTESPEVKYAREEMLLPGSYVVYECIDNHKVSGQWGVISRMTSYCSRSEDGSTWNPLLEEIRCQEILCTHPRVGIGQTLTSYKDSWHVGEIATARCEDGHGFSRPRYINTLSCTNYQSWNDSFTPCQDISCITPRRTIENGYRLTWNDTTVVYKCNSSFKFRGTELETIKTAKCFRKYYFRRGQWSVDLYRLRCEKIKCEKPPEQWHMESYKIVNVNWKVGDFYARFNNWKAGEEAHFKCNPGYKFGDTSSEYVTARCLETGRWNGALLPCVGEVECREPPERITNGRRVTLSEHSHNLGSNAKYQCNEGHIFSKLRFYPTSMNVMCTKKDNALEGEWSPAPSDLSCEVTSCSLPDISSEQIRITPQKGRWKVGETLTTGCKQGYGFVTESYTDTITCTDHEKWNASLTKCQPIRCTNPEFSADANLIDRYSQIHSDRLVVKCRSQYRFIGEQSKRKRVRCKRLDKTINGVWEPPLSTLRCEPDVNCTFQWNTCGYENNGWGRGERIRLHFISATRKVATIVSPVITPQYANGSYICVMFRYRLISRSKLLLQLRYDDMNDVWIDSWLSNQKERTFSWLDSFINVAVNQSLRYQFSASLFVFLSDLQVRKEKCYDRCEVNPCMNGGSCVSRIGGFTCFCQVDYVGEHCGTDIKCSQPPRTLPNTSEAVIEYASGVMLLPGSTITYTCIPSYEIPGQTGGLNRITSTCNATQTYGGSVWTPILDGMRCQEILCNPPELNTEHLLVNPQDSWSVGTNATVRCKNGYGFSLERFTNMLSCTNSGKWSSVFTPCQDIRCSKPAKNITNGYRSKANITSVTYQCGKKFKFIGTELEKARTVNCHRFYQFKKSQWAIDLSALECERIQCNKPPGELHLQSCRRYKQRWNAGQKEKFRCDSGYKFNHTDSQYIAARCLNTGQWNEALLPCVGDSDFYQHPRRVLTDSDEAHEV